MAGEYAQRVVLTWLTTPRAKPDPLLALVGDARVATLPELPFTAADSAVAGVTQSSGIWSVTVAVTVTDDRKITSRRFFQVPVLVAGGAVTALSLPAAVSAPIVGIPPRTGYRSQLSAGSAVGVTVTQFLAAYTAGAGDVSRYLTPGHSLAALSPAPYTAVRLTELRSDSDIAGDAVPRDQQRMRVMALASVTVTDRQVSTVAYALTLTSRAGRWEVAAIDPVPAVAPQGAAGQQTSPTRATPATATPTNETTGTPPSSAP